MCLKNIFMILTMTYVWDGQYGLYWMSLIALLDLCETHFTHVWDSEFDLFDLTHLQPPNNLTGLQSGRCVMLHTAELPFSQQLWQSKLHNLLFTFSPSRESSRSWGVWVAMTPVCMHTSCVKCLTGLDVHTLMEVKLCWGGASTRNNMYWLIQ